MNARMSVAGFALQASTHRVKASRTSAAGISLQASNTSLSALIRRIMAATGSGSHLSALGQASSIVVLLRGSQVTCVSFVLSPTHFFNSNSSIDVPSDIPHLRNLRPILDIPRARSLRVIVFIAADIKSGDLVLMDKVQWPLAVAMDTVPCVHGPVYQESRALREGDDSVAGEIVDGGGDDRLVCSA